MNAQTVIENVVEPVPFTADELRLMQACVGFLTRTQTDPALRARLAELAEHIEQRHRRALAQARSEDSLDGRLDASGGEWSGDELPAGLACGFGLCREPATEVVETRMPVGGCVEWLCSGHADRRGELQVVIRRERLRLMEDGSPPPIAMAGPPQQRRASNT